MEKEAAIALYVVLERRTYPYDDGSGEATLYPRLAVRLDAGIDKDEERSYRIFVQIAAGFPTEDYPDEAIEIIREAQEAGVKVAFENHGIALT